MSRLVGSLRLPLESGLFRLLIIDLFILSKTVQKPKITHWSTFLEIPGITEWIAVKLGTFASS